MSQRFLTKYFNDFVLQGTVCDALIWKYQAISELSTIYCVSALDPKNADNKIRCLPLKKQANNSIGENTSQHDVPHTADGWRWKFRIKLIHNKLGYLLFSGPNSTISQSFTSSRSSWGMVPMTGVHSYDKKISVYRDKTFFPQELVPRNHNLGNRAVMSKIWLVFLRKLNLPTPRTKKGREKRPIVMRKAKGGGLTLKLCLSEALTLQNSSSSLF